MSSPASAAPKAINVLHPMGWDAFGLPAENAARDKGVSPRDWTYDNIAAMRDAVEDDGPVASTGRREFATCDPDYYHQQQKLFLDFYKAGFVYRSEADVNWDPVDMTVLANEQVIDGRGWRSGALVERRKLSQWFFKITAFADDLLTALDTLERWPEKVRLMQKNWIGRSEGLRFQFTLSNGEQAGCLHHAARHAVRRQLRRAVAGSSADAGTGEEGRQAGGLHRRMPPYRHRRSRHREGREDGLRHRPDRGPSVRCRTGSCR